MENIKKRILEVMSSVFEIDESALNEDSSIDNVENWDSIRHLNLILAIEDEFSITIPDDQVGDLVNFSLVELIIKEQIK